MKIARVFPTKTSMSPQDRDAYFSVPELFMPEYDEVHISVTFTWDIPMANWLKKQWDPIASVKIGGPAISGEKESFIPGIYLKDGITKTSIGCPNNCGWCFVNQPLKELKIHPGNNIIDNNLLACSGSHINKVFQMLKNQNNIQFSGGLENSRINEKIVDQLRGLKIGQLFLAYDHPMNFNHLEKAVSILSKYFKRDKIRCFVLIGYRNDAIEKARERLIEAWEVGTLPFAMLYRNKKGEFPEPYKEWRRIHKVWSRPAFTKAYVKNGYKDINSV